MASMSMNMKTMSRAMAMERAKHLGLTGVHEMPDGKYHPGKTHKAMVTAIRRHNGKGKEKGKR